MDMRHNLPDGQPHYAETMRAVRAEQARERYMAERVEEIQRLLVTHPLSTQPQHAVVSFYGRSAGRVPLIADLVGYVIDHALDVEQTLGEALVNEPALGRLFQQYAEQRAGDECDRMSDDEMTEAA